MCIVMQVIVSTGSEVGLAVDAAKKVEGKAVSIVTRGVCRDACHDDDFYGLCRFVWCRCHARSCLMANPSITSKLILCCAHHDDVIIVCSCRRKSLFPDGVPVLSVEASVSFGWERYSHAHIGCDTFGHSAPYQAVYAAFGITVDGIAAKAGKVCVYVTVGSCLLTVDEVIVIVWCGVVCAVVGVLQ